LADLVALKASLEEMDFVFGIIDVDAHVALVDSILIVTEVSFASALWIKLSISLVEEKERE